MRLTVLVLASAILLAGCEDTPIVAIGTDVDMARVPPQEAMRKCPRAKPLEGKTLGELVTKLKEVSEALSECSDIHDELVDWVRRGDVKP